MLSVGYMATNLEGSPSGLGRDEPVDGSAAISVRQRLHPAQLRPVTVPR
jgi:hypothetical protein